MIRALRLAASAFVFAAVLAVAASGALLQPRLTFDAPVEGLAIEHGSLWVSIAGDDLILRLDVRTGRRLAQIPVHQANRRALGGGTLVAGRGKIWIAAPVRVTGDPTVGDAWGWIGRLDPHTLRLDLIQTHSPDRPVYVAVGSGAVWVSGFRALRRVDPASDRVTGTVRFDRYVGAVAATGGRVWVAGSNTGFLKEIDARTLQVKASVTVGRSAAGSSLAVVGRRIWAATDRGLVAVDSVSARIVARIRLPRASAVAFDGSRLWVLARGAVYTIRGRIVSRRLRLASPVYGLLVAGAGGAWLSDEATNSLRRISFP
jgi:hypothetical protein